MTIRIISRRGLRVLSNCSWYSQSKIERMLTRFSVELCQQKILDYINKYMAQIIKREINVIKFNSQT